MRVLGISFVVAGMLTAAAAAETSYERRVIAPGLPVHGVTGLAFGPDGALYGGAVIGPGIFRLDLKTRTMTPFVGAEGEADDLAFAPRRARGAGTLAWTALTAGEIRTRAPDGTLQTIARDLPLVNPIAFDGAGRLYAGQFGMPDKLFEIDPEGAKPPRLIGQGLGGINAFEPDGRGGLIAPLADKGALARIDLASGKVRILAEGLGQVVAAKQDPKGKIVAIAWDSGTVVRVDPKSGGHEVLTRVTPPLDNVAVAPDGMIYVSRPTDNAIVAIDPATGAQTTVVKSALVAPGGLTVTRRDGRPALLVADAYGYRTVDVDSGEATVLPFVLGAATASDIAESGDHLLLSYVRRPSVSQVERATGKTLHTWTGFKAPYGIVARGSTIFVADYGTGDILALDTRDPARRETVASGLRGPVDLIDDNGALVVAEATAGAVTRIGPDGNRTVIADGLVQPEGLARLPDGTLAVVEVGARRLTLLSSGRKRIIAEDLPVGGVYTRAPAPIYLPSSVTADSGGTLYVAGDVDNSIHAFAPAGAAPLRDVLDRLTTLLPGTYSTAPQVDAEAKAGIAKERQHVRRHVVYAPITAPQVGAHVLYRQERESGPDGKIVGQSLAVLAPDPEAGGVRMWLRSIVNAARFKDLHLRPDLWPVVTFDPAYGGKCPFHWRLQDDRAIGTLVGGRCEIISNAGRPMAFEARWEWSSSGVSIFDNTYDGGGKLLAGRSDRVPTVYSRAP